MSRAEYMRQYRLKRKGQVVETTLGRPHEIILDLTARIADLQAEVAHLKRELAARPADVEHGSAEFMRHLERSIGRPNPIEFRPVPKPGKRK